MLPEIRKLLLLCPLLLLVACGVTPASKEEFRLEPTTYDQLPGWPQDTHEEALKAFSRSCEPLVKASQKQPTKVKPALEVWQELCAKTAAYSGRARQYFESFFMPYQIKNGGEAEGLFTGYYQPMLRGCRKRSERYDVPVYGLPDDITKGQPYYSRAEIEAGALGGKGLEILWVDDAIDLFFAQVQGSARVKLQGGGETAIGFAGKNGHGYTAIGKHLIDIGAIEKQDVSMQSIKRWLRLNPGDAQEVMNLNASYVFFKEQDTADAIGAQGVPLIAQRSAAIDKANLAYGLPLYIDTTLPTEAGSTPYRRLMVAQDTGGAIKGAVRMDVFFGADERAEWLAGHMKQKGRMYLLLPEGAVSGLAW